jgi:hypothetical protein
MASIKREVSALIARANKAILLCLVCLIVGAIPTRSIYAQSAAGSLATCGQASGSSAAISSVGTPAPLILRPELRDGRVVVVGHLYTRNDSGFPLSHWCARGYFFNYLDRPQDVKLSLNGPKQSSQDACVSLQVEAGLVQDFVFTIEVGEEALPVSGLVTLQASGIAEKQQSCERTKKKPIAARGGSGLHTKQEPEKCAATSKEISQSVVLTSAESAFHAGELILATGLIGGAFLLYCLGRFKGNLRAPMGASQWTFSSSAATNLTFVGSLLGMVLVSSSIPDFPHQMTKQSFTVLSLTFAVFAGLSPILYNFCCEPVGLDSANSQLLDFQGWVWLFLIADGLTIWAVCGQLGTLGLLFNEFANRQHISRVIAGCAWCVAVAVGVALLIYCFRSARFYVERHPSREVGAVEEVKEETAGARKRTAGPRWTAL